MKTALASILRPHRFFILFLLITQITLGTVIAKTGQWSAWINGDIQSMLTLRYFVRDGFFQPHAFLFIPQGYTPFIKLFETADLQDHALGSWYVKNGNLIKRVYYNHYPNFNLIPLALVAALAGSEHKLLFQITLMALSATGAVFLYAFLIALFRSRMAAAVASAGYLVSNLYTDWVHATNVAIDDFLKYPFLLISVLEKKSKPELKKYYTAWLWAVYFFMSVTTLESIIFGYIWLIGYDLIETRQIRWKRWFIFGTAPILARAVQLIQSLSVFGWNDTLADWFGRFNTMANQDGQATLLDHLLSVSREIRYLIGFGWDKHRIIELHLLVIFFVAFILIGIFLLAQKEKKRTGSWWKTNALVPVILFGAGTGFGLVFPGASWMRYEGRQFIPFFMSLIAYVWIEWPALPGRKFKALIFFFLIIPILGATARQTYLTVRNVTRGYPEYSFGKYEPESFKLGAEIKKYANNRESMIFMLQEKTNLIPFQPNPQFPTREVYAMDPQLLYAADAHIMVFKNREALIQDLELIDRRIHGDNKPFVIADSEDGLKALRNELVARNYSAGQTEILTGPWQGILFTSSR